MKPSILAVMTAVALASSAAPSAVSARPPEAVVAVARKPLVVVFADNVGTEAVDFVAPYGIVSASGAAEVVAVSLTEGPVHMQPALTIQAQDTITTFDARHPEGADYVVIPAISRRNDPAALTWLRGQAAKGAVLISICDGAWTLAATGLLDGHRATAHWASIADLTKAYPNVVWVRDQRYVRDGAVQSTTGVSAAIPASLALVEQIAGHETAARVAAEYGVSGWSAGYDSRPFRLGTGHVWTAVANTLAFWSHQRLGILVQPGVDEVALALTADPYARTYRSKVVILGADAAPVTTEHGLRLLPDGMLNTTRVSRLITPTDTRPLEAALATIEASYGRGTRDLVALQLESPGN